jgi:hypothetical protein
VAPDNPVHSDFAALTSALCAFTVHRSRPLHAVDRCSAGSSDTVQCTPDNPVNYIGAPPRKPKSGQFVGALA